MNTDLLTENIFGPDLWDDHNCSRLWQDLRGVTYRLTYRYYDEYEKYRIQ